MAGHVRYIVLSDLHLGAENSILTLLRTGTTLADSHHPSPVLTALVDCLRVVSSADGGELPTMIVAGDLIELALASPASSLPVVALFAETLAGGEQPVVRNEAVFVPGNHDHHIWELSREKAARDFLRAGTPLGQEPATWHTSSMFLSQPPHYTAPLLEDPCTTCATPTGPMCASCTPTWPWSQTTAGAPCS